MELTKEYFDKGIGNILEQVTDVKTGLRTLEAKVTNLEAKMVTKDELKNALEAQTKELKDYTHESFETRQVWMDERFKELIVAYDVRERVVVLEKDVAHLKLGRKAHA
jgi:hypothetical protein